MSNDPYVEAIVLYVQLCGGSMSVNDSNWRVSVDDVAAAGWFINRKIKVQKPINNRRTESREKGAEDDHY